MQEKDYDKCHEPLAFPVSFSSRSLHADLRMKINKKKINLKKLRAPVLRNTFITLLHYLS